VTEDQRKSWNSLAISIAVGAVIGGLMNIAGKLDQIIELLR